MSDSPIKASALTAREGLRDAATWTVGLGVTLGLASSSVGPWIVGGLVDTRRFNLQQASFMVTIEQVAMGLVMFVLAGNLHRVPRRSLLIAGVMMALLSQLVSFAVENYGAMAIARTVSGIGFACIYATSTAMGASTRDPDRTFAVAQGMTQLAAMALNPMLGLGAEYPGQKGVFAVVAIFSLVLAVPFLGLALRKNSPAVARAVEVGSAIPLISKTFLGVLALMSVYSLATGGAWTFMERVAGSVGLSGTRLGSGLIATSLIGTLGSVLASRLGTRYGRLWPLCSGLVSLGLATIWLLLPGSALQFWLAISLWAFLFTFTTPYVFGLAAAADASGRVVASTGTAFIIVSAIGASFGAFLVTHFGLAKFGMTVMAMLALAAVIAVLVSRHSLRSVPLASPEAAAPEDLTPAPGPNPSEQPSIRDR